MHQEEDLLRLEIRELRLKKQGPWLTADAARMFQNNPFHSSTIICLAVAEGIAALGIIGFIIKKPTQKQFSDLDDPDGKSQFFSRIIAV